MQKHVPGLLFAGLLLILGASSPANGEKELIIRLQGEVLVLQRQVRDLQESFDKWQGQSSSSLQKINDNSSATVGSLAAIEDALKSSQSSQNNGLAGANSQLQKIADLLSKQNQSFNGLSQQINSVKQSIQDYQQKLENRSERQPDASSFANNPEGLYALAYGQYGKGDYESAIRNFKAFLNIEGQSEDSDDARFWMAESLLALGRRAEALREYETILSEAPRGDKAQKAFLRKGVTLLHLERREEGVAVLRSIIGQSPGSQEAIQARNELNRLGESN